MTTRYLFPLLLLVIACDSPGGTRSGALPTCNNGQLDPGEICDGAIVGPNTCQSAGYERGVLVCNRACTNFDYGGCTGGTGPQPDTIQSDTNQPDTSQPNNDTISPANRAPNILSLTSNTSTLNAESTLIITAVVTDPDGIDDLIGGQLESPSGGTYGAFATSAAEGSYTIALTWDALNTVRAIEAAPAGSPLSFKAVFFDVAGTRAERTLTVTVRCNGSGVEALCDGECTNLRSSPRDCGQCNHDCSEQPAFSNADFALCLASTCVTPVTVDTGRVNAGATCKTLCAEAGYSCPFTPDVAATHFRGSGRGQDVTIELGCNEAFTQQATVSLYFAECYCAAGTGVPNPNPNPNPTTIVGIQSSAASVSCTTMGDQAVGQTVDIEGVVVVPRFRLNSTLSAIFLSDGTREAYSGLLVRFPASQTVDFVKGDKVRVTGKHYEFYCMTQFAATNLVKIGTGTVPSARTIAKNLPAADLEKWESVIVQFDNVTVTNYNEVGDADTNAGILVDDFIMGTNFVVPEIGTNYQWVRGALVFGFERYRIAPRDDADY